MAHTEVQLSAAENVRVGKPGAGQFLAVERGTLNVNILVRIVLRNNRKYRPLRRVFNFGAMN